MEEFENQSSSQNYAVKLQDSHVLQIPAETSQEMVQYSSKTPI